MSNDSISAAGLPKMAILKDSPLFLMTLLTRLHRNLTHEKLRAHADISLEMLLAMHVIYEFQPIKQQQIADCLMYDRSAAKRTVDNMLKRGWVTTMKDDNNQKNKLVALTDSGLDIMKLCTAVAKETRSSFMEGLTEEESHELTLLCKKALSVHYK